MARGERPSTGSSARPVGRDEVRSAVLEAAAELFARRGPRGVSVRDVARKAGVNHALVHRHFGTKDHLLRMVLAEAMERMTTIARDARNTREDLAMVLSAVRREELTVRLFAWALLTDYPLDELWTSYPVVRRFRALLEEETRGSNREAADREEERVAVAAVTAMAFGWVIFAPWLDRALDLEDIADLDLELALNRLSQALLDLAR